jgi:hypothetical protein
MAVYPEYPRKKKIYPEPVVNIAYSVAETVDEFTDSIAGIRPVGHAMEVLRNIAPANVIRRVTGIPKPSEVVEEILDRIDEEIGRGPLIRRFRRW